MSDLLGLAEAQLNSPTPHSNRMACWLARSALEELIDRLLEARDLDVGEGASTRSRLTILEVAYEGTPVPAKAQYAWSRLSDACHQHAYELSPNFAETNHLLATVRSIVNPHAAPPEGEPIT